MAHVLPLPGHPAREMFDVADLVDVAMGRAPCFVLPAARAAARKFFAGADPAAKRVVYFVVRAEDDQLQLVSFGRRLGWKVEWRFGPCGRNVRIL